jgi:hydrogenase maturation factor
MTSTTESACATTHCITCADEGVPMTVLRIDRQRVLALCADEQGEHHTVETELVLPVGVGQALLVHAGVAIAALPDGVAA